MSRFTVAQLAKALTESDLVADAGRARLREALVNAAEEKAQLKPSRPMVHLRLKKGEQVPELLRTVPELERLVGKPADGDWSKSWTDVSVWTRTWHNNGADRVIERERVDLRTKLGTALFDDDDLKALREAGVAGDLLTRFKPAAK